jgi:hypothetical protein
MYAILLYFISDYNISTWMNCWIRNGIILSLSAINIHALDYLLILPPFRNTCCQLVQKWTSRRQVFWNRGSILLYIVIQLVSYHFSSLIKEFDRILKDDESKNPPEINKQLNDRKQFMVGELLTVSLLYFTCSFF